MTKEMFCAKELDDFTKDLFKLALEFENGKQAKKFLTKTGNKLRNESRKLAKMRVGKKTGNLIKGFRRGKIYKYKGKDLSVRVFNNAPHAHLLNYGHFIVNKKGEEIGFAKGHNFMEDAADNFRTKHMKDTEKWLDEMLNKHGM